MLEKYKRIDKLIKERHYLDYLNDDREYCAVFFRERFMLVKYMTDDDIDEKIKGMMRLKSFGEVCEMKRMFLGEFVLFELYHRLYGKNT